MKTYKQTFLPFTTLLFLIITSCQKSIETNKQNNVQTDAQTDNLFGCNNCLVTHTEDNVFGHVIDFFYNKRGSPDSINFDGTPVTFQYDKWGRLIKETFGTWAWNEFKYKGISPLPIAYYDYYPSFGGLIGIDSFKYNFRGEMISRTGDNLLLPKYNYIEHYAYNIMGNVIRVDIAAHNGGTVFNPGYTEFTETKYDNKLNFTAGSIWTKFIMFNTGYDGLPFYWMLFSRNNAANYKWIQGSEGYGLLASSTFDYNNKGFANNINIDFTDIITGEDYGIFTRTSSSTCDNALYNHLSSKSLLFKEKINKTIYGLPSVIK